MGTADDRARRKYDLAIGALIAALAGFFLLLSICVWMEPAGLWANHGFSYYGDLPDTLLPYRLAFFLADMFTLLSALLLPNVMPSCLYSCSSLPAGWLWGPSGTAAMPRAS